MSKGTQNMNQIASENKKLRRDLVIIQNVNNRLKKKIILLEKHQVKGDYSIAEGIT